MIYCVVPKALETSCSTKLVEHYRDDDNVEVIVERRRFDRRARQRPRAEPAICERRMIRDRRRARVAGDMLPLAHA